MVEAILRVCQGELVVTPEFLRNLLSVFKLKETEKERKSLQVVRRLF